MRPGPTRTPMKSRGMEASPAESQPSVGFCSAEKRFAANSEPPSRRAFSSCTSARFSSAGASLRASASSVSAAARAPCDASAKALCSRISGLAGCPSGRLDQQLRRLGRVAEQELDPPDGVENRRVSRSQRQRLPGHGQRLGRLLLAHGHVVGEVVQRDGVVRLQRDDAPVLLGRASRARRPGVYSSASSSCGRTTLGASSAACSSSRRAPARSPRLDQRFAAHHQPHHALVRARAWPPRRPRSGAWRRRPADRAPDRCRRRCRRGSAPGARTARRADRRRPRSASSDAESPDRTTRSD